MTLGKGLSWRKNHKEGRLASQKGTALLVTLMVLTGEDRRLGLDNGDKLSVYYSSLALSIVGSLLGSGSGWGGSASWRLVRNC